MDRDDVLTATTDRITGDLTFWGDAASELAFGGDDYGIRVFGGPSSAETLGEADADLAFDTPYHDALLFGDPDGDGTIELIAADSSYGEADASGHTPGMVAVYDLSGL